MYSKIIQFSLRNKFLVSLLVIGIIGYGIFALSRIPVGVVPDITNNQIQVITTSRSLSTEDVEQFITYPVELEMANLPGVKKIRSISKFGLSVVTVIFEDEMGTYLPRQLTAEKIRSAAKKIPAKFGTPEMGPITTGLGEIYHYTVETKEGYEDQYDLTQLRSIQDWLIKRQLSGIKGVVEVNTWGGYLKQYEVAISTDELEAVNLSVRDVFQALEKNNSVAGGSYIEKNDQAYFIRGNGLINDLAAISKTVVTNRNGTPILIEDIADVQIGHANRFGAVTANGEGEKVLGQIMMLKGANSSDVIQRVNKRLDKVRKSLPEGIRINGFLDRSELIDKTTSTIQENLFLGFIVVSFIVILLLGDWRSGLIIASMIPLSFLFAISLMYIFGIPANLLSLGALDFGIIIDGGVIIVEFVALKVFQRYKGLQDLPKKERRKEMDNITFDGASRMMNSAIFGQLIIFIVFIPILSLSGVEGKMFIPMALTFCFALLGAMILCFTWIPVAASLFLKPKNIKPNNIGSRIIDMITRSYDPVISWALKRRKLVIGLSVVFLGFGIWIYSKSGGEFVPTLDEGSFVIQPVLKTGKSLQETIERTTDIEKILLDKFPEVKQVITRIGAAEVPTDPMSMEETDIIVLLKPKDEWVSADTKEELANEMKAALSIFPKMPIEFTQPIEMRFNELITGSRSDIAIKVYGEDLDILAQKGDEIKALIRGIPGAADISVDKITGLPQMKVDFKRDELARYGLNIQDLNDVIATGFAGRSTGVVFEGEKRFDLVVRLKESERNSLEDLSNLIIDAPNGNKITLSDVADIRYGKSPAMISREDTRRRTTVGVNVRQSDLETVVNKIRDKLDSELSLPAGYSVEYGGQFENLKKAKSRLQIAVPFALLLIFILLYFALRSVKDTVLIFLSIPFAAVGGILLLWLRDMPFSISGGVGFIALFGIAVLNGIILIDYINTYKAKGEAITPELMKKVTKERIRAILLTASSTALGFLPMAISTGSGAEVQRPLATVVIGGLITSSLLTLVVLPVVYLSVYKMKKVRISKKATLLILITVLSLLPLSGSAQQTELDSLKSIMLENNYDILSKKLNEEKADAAKGEAFDFQRTSVFIGKDENEIPMGVDQGLNQYGISQTFDFPTVYSSRLAQKKAERELAASFTQLTESQKVRQLALLYDSFSIAQQKLKYLRSLSDLYQRSVKRLKRKYELGDTTKLASMRERSKYAGIVHQINILSSQVESLRISIDQLVLPEESVKINGRQPVTLEIDKVSMENNPSLQMFQQQVKASAEKENALKNEYLPGIYGSYAITERNDIDRNLQVFQIGLKIPLLFFGERSRVLQQKIQLEQDELQLKAAKTQLNNEQERLMNQFLNHQKSKQMFEEERLPLARSLKKTAVRSFELGEINFFEYVQTMEEAIRTRLDHLDFLERYNKTVIQYNNLLIR